MHHITYSIPVANVDKVISEMAIKGMPVVTSANYPIANIVFSDTTKYIAVFPEVMGMTEEGEKTVQKMKSGNN